MPNLGRLTSMLTDCKLGDQMLQGRIEAFSCKKAGDDKKLSKALQQKFQKKRKRSRGESVTININTTNATTTPGSTPTTTSTTSTTTTATATATSTISVSTPVIASFVPIPVGAAALAMRETTKEDRITNKTNLINSNDNENSPNGISGGAPKRPRSSSFIKKQQMSRQSSNHSFEQSQSASIVPPHIRTHASDLSVDVTSNTQQLTREDEATRKVIIDLISTLNAMNEDYDFSESRVEEQFVRHHSINDIIPIVNKNLAEVMELRVEGFLNQLWSEVDKAIQVRQCQVYSYLPAEGDPFCGPGVLWSFNYFFYNHELNRVLCFSCIADSKWGSDPSPRNIRDRPSGSPLSFQSPAPSPSTTPHNGNSHNNSPWNSHNNSDSQSSSSNYSSATGYVQNQKVRECSNCASIIVVIIIIVVVVFIFFLK